MLQTDSKNVILQNPSLDDVINELKAGISKHKNILIVCDCEVEYEGRASSKLQRGERIIILKSDGSALIHRPKDYSPINWQPPGSLFKTRMSDNNIILRIYRRKDREVMEVKLLNVMMFASLSLKDSGEFTLYASEKDMQEAIIYKPILLEEGFRPISAERPVDPGFIDILGIDKNGILTVVEIKRIKASKESVLQLKKYIDVIQVDKNRNVRAILVAPEFSKGVHELLLSFGFEYKILSPQKCAEVIKKKNGKQITEFFK